MRDRIAEQDVSLILTVEAACLATNGLLSERRIWRLIKENQLTCVDTENGVGIDYFELKRYLSHEDFPLASNIAA